MTLADTLSQVLLLLYARVYEVFAINYGVKHCCDTAPTAGVMPRGIHSDRNRLLTSGKLWARFYCVVARGVGTKVLWLFVVGPNQIYGHRFTLDIGT
jgi:hypothetical protein